MQSIMPPDQPAVSGIGGVFNPCFCFGFIQMFEKPTQRIKMADPHLALFVVNEKGNIGIKRRNGLPQNFAENAIVKVFLRIRLERYAEAKKAIIVWTGGAL